MSWKSLLFGIWTFPILLTVILVTLTASGISGSSIGTYHDFFNGPLEADQNLIANEPRPIRSDEWLVATQMTLAQVNNGYIPVNDNIGDGSDMTLLLDVPYKEWSAVFKPHNLAFFVLPDDNAFAFRWWFMGYLLILGGYFFTLVVMPGRIALAALIGLSLYFSPFVHWWYQYGTLGPIYYVLFGLICAHKIVTSQSLKGAWVWSAVLAYVGTCFALVFYPPFQVACLIVGLAFLIGMVLEQLRTQGYAAVSARLRPLLAGVFIAAVLTGTFVATRSDTVDAARHTVYPGQREVLSGGYSLTHLAAGHLSAPLQSNETASSYLLPKQGITNQSEASNFFLFVLLLVPILLVWQVREFRRSKRLDWSVIISAVLLILFLMRLFLPGSDLIFKPLLLTGVPHTRLLIGLGLLSVLSFVFTLRVGRSNPFRLPTVLALTVSSLVVLLGVGYELREIVPEFVTQKRMIITSILASFIIGGSLLARWQVFAVSLLLLLSIVSTYKIHPLYRGMAVITETPLAHEMKSLAASNPDARWILEGIMLENFALANGIKSLSGVYSYPQIELWEEAGFAGQADIYNRYAHFNVVLDRDYSSTVPTRLSLVQADSFVAFTEPCSAFLKDEGVRFLVTSGELDASVSCAKLESVVEYPAATFYIYQFNY